MCQFDYHTNIMRLCVFIGKFRIKVGVFFRKLNIQIKLFLSQSIMRKIIVRDYSYII